MNAVSFIWLFATRRNFGARASVWVQRGQWSSSLQGWQHRQPLQLRPDRRIRVEDFENPGQVLATGLAIGVAGLGVLAPATLAS